MKSSEVKVKTSEVCTTCGYFLYFCTSVPLYLSISMLCFLLHIPSFADRVVMYYAKPSNLPPSFLLPPSLFSLFSLFCLLGFFAELSQPSSSTANPTSLKTLTI